MKIKCAVYADDYTHAVIRNYEKKLRRVCYEKRKKPPLREKNSPCLPSSKV